MHILFVVERGTEKVRCPVCGGWVELFDDGEDLYVDGCEHLQGCEVELVDGRWEILVPMPEDDDTLNTE